MKILFLSAFFPSPTADSAGVLDAYHLLRELSKRNEVTLLSFAAGEDRKQIPSLREMCRSVITVDPPALPGSNRYLFYTGLSFGSKLPAIARMSHSRHMVHALLEQFSHQQFDIVHVEFTQMAHYVEYLNGVPAVLDESDLAFVRRERFARTTKSLTTRILLEWDTRKLKEYEIHYCGRFDGILVRTQQDKNVLKGFLPTARIEVISPWVDLSFAGRIDQLPAEEELLFYGAMWRPVNDQAAIYFINEILPRIRSKRPNTKLTVLGSRPGKRLTELQAKNVVVTGYVEDVAPYYSRASVVIVPLLSGAGIKGKVIQGLACGKPVVTTSVGAEGIPAAEEDGLFVHDDPQHFAERVLWLLEERRYLSFRDPARRFARKFHDWAAGVSRLEGLYEEIAKGVPVNSYC